MAVGRDPSSGRFVSLLDASVDVSLDTSELDAGLSGLEERTTGALGGIEAGTADINAQLGRMSYAGTRAAAGMASAFDPKFGTAIHGLAIGIRVLLMDFRAYQLALKHVQAEQTATAASATAAGTQVAVAGTAAQAGWLKMLGPLSVIAIAVAAVITVVALLHSWWKRTQKAAEDATEAQLAGARKVTDAWREIIGLLAEARGSYMGMSAEAVQLFQQYLRVLDEIGEMERKETIGREEAVRMRMKLAEWYYTAEVKLAKKATDEREKVWTDAAEKEEARQLELHQIVQDLEDQARLSTLEGYAEEKAQLNIWFRDQAEAIKKTTRNIYEYGDAIEQLTDTYIAKAAALSRKYWQQHLEDSKKALKKDLEARQSLARKVTELEEQTGAEVSRAAETYFDYRIYLINKEYQQRKDWIDANVRDSVLADRLRVQSVQAAEDQIAAIQQEKWDHQDRMLQEIYRATGRETQAELMEIQKRVEAFREAGVAEVEIRKYVLARLRDLAEGDRTERMATYRERAFGGMPGIVAPRPVAPVAEPGKDLEELVGLAADQLEKGGLTVEVLKQILEAIKQAEPAAATFAA